MAFFIHFQERDFFLHCNSWHEFKFLYIESRRCRDDLFYSLQWQQQQEYSSLIESNKIILKFSPCAFRRFVSMESSDSAKECLQCKESCKFLSAQCFNYSNAALKLKYQQSKVSHERYFYIFYPYTA